MFLRFWESHFIFLFEGSFHLASIKFILPHLDSNSSNVNKELLEEIAIDDQIAMQIAITCVNIWEYFTSTELDEENR
jgi:hypothetical protein